MMKTRMNDVPESGYAGSRTTGMFIHNQKARFGSTK